MAGSRRRIVSAPGFAVCPKIERAVAQTGGSGEKDCFAIGDKPSGGSHRPCPRMTASPGRNGGRIMVPRGGAERRRHRPAVVETPVRLAQMLPQFGPISSRPAFRCPGVNLAASRGCAPGAIQLRVVFSFFFKLITFVIRRSRPFRDCCPVAGGGARTRRWGCRIAAGFRTRLRQFCGQLFPGHGFWMGHGARCDPTRGPRVGCRFGGIRGPVRVGC